MSSRVVSALNVSSTIDTGVSITKGQRGGVAATGVSIRSSGTPWLLAYGFLAVPKRLVFFRDRLTRLHHEEVGSLGRPMPYAR